MFSHSDVGEKQSALYVSRALSISSLLLSGIHCLSASLQRLPTPFLNCLVTQMLVKNNPLYMCWLALFVSSLLLSGIRCLSASLRSLPTRSSRLFCFDRLSQIWRTMFTSRDYRYRSKYICMDGVHLSALGFCSTDRFTLYRSQPLCV